MPNQAPPIDRRTSRQIVERVERLARASGWQPRADGHPDGGQALIQIFARLAELLIERVNRAPEKNFLAFLDLIGVQPLPPQPARAPLTFTLAAGSLNDAIVPARTPVAAAPLPGDAAPVVFETEADLVVTRSELAAVFVREPGRDRFGGPFPPGAPASEGAFPVFAGERPTAHRLYLAHAGQFGLQAATREIRLRFAPASGEQSWLAAVRWAAWDATRKSYVDLPAESVGAPTISSDGAWQISLANPPELPLGPPHVPAGADPALAGLTSRWLRVELPLPLPRHDRVEELAALGPPTSWRSGLAPDAARRDDKPLSTGGIFFPFGENEAATTLLLASEAAFGAVGAAVHLGFELDRPGRPHPELELLWEYWNGVDWRDLGASTPRHAPAAPTPTSFVDETLALTRDGAVSFVCPADWSPLDLGDNVGRRWLRVRIVAGGYSTAAGLRPPAVRSLSISYGQPPEIQTVLSQVFAAESGLAPEAAMVNELPTDLSKDLFPFGEKPKFNDTFALASGSAFLKPGAEVTLTFTLSNPTDDKVSPLPARPSDDITLAWEYWDAARGAWQPLKVKDKTSAFTKDKGTVTFTVPATLGVIALGGQERAWIRVRLARGNYGVDATYEPLRDAGGNLIGVDGKPTALAVYQLRPATFRPPAIKSVVVAYSYTSPFERVEQLLAENDFVVEEVGRERPEDDGPKPFRPFRPTTHGERPALYLGFRRPGARAGFANSPNTLFFDVDEVLYGEQADSFGALAEGAGVAWEFWGGAGWRRLGTRDETRSLTRRGLLSFVGPHLFPPRHDFGLGEELFWLRATWERGAYSVLPRLRAVLTNTIWASHVRTSTGEVLGSSSGEPGQRFRAASAPVLPGQRLEVREPELPAAAEQSVLAAEEGPDAIGVTPAQGGGATEIWVRWHEVPNFYGSGPRSRHYTLDRTSGEVRFGDGRHGLVPPAGRANVRLAAYRTGGGVAGNRPAGNLNQIQTTVPLVDGVANLTPAAGGTPGESLEAMLERGPRTLRHRDRAVLIADFEDLAVQASPEVALVRGLPAADHAGAGAVVLVVVPRSAALKPIPTVELLGRVQDYLAARMTPAVDLLVRGPDWLKVSVQAEVVPVAPEEAADVQTAVHARLDTFLHPLTGGLDRAGWPFGRKPYRSDLYALIERVPGVSYVRRLAVDETPDTGGARDDRFLVYSGDHEITMAGSD